MMSKPFVINSFSANGNIADFANYTYSGESMSNELSHMNQYFLLIKYEAILRLLLHEKWSRPILKMEESTLGNSELKE